ncbi:RNA methyltransferase [Microseira wollei]|uniref:tRNA (cytidine/uridine-2'-O-)-methyltransferase TrmJ n=1 Tax=Microseira wollei NIES-4236 TaxID=2530354 RepID=A0AAV3XGJ2_9CYAN|nr:RNA methyltransferase [Microseira wollei]GET41388.1 putative tRNA/rRNA methyltransferase [Microseira wollei NIES-4236]
MDETSLDEVRIVLVQPIGPLNVGSVARGMKNMGLRHLVLVEPLCDYLGEQARLMAVHAQDLLAAARVVATLPEALAGCTKAIATTSVERSRSIQLENPRTALPWLLQAGPSALIFGSEDRGLSNDELKYAQRFVRIPSSDAYHSLNLAQAVAVCCYELYQSAISQDEAFGENAPGSMMNELSSLSSPHPPLKKGESLEKDLVSRGIEGGVPLEALEQYYEHLEAVLLKIGYLYPHTAASRMAKFRLLFNRTQLSTQEVAMLRGILSQVEWAICNGAATQVKSAQLEGSSTAVQPDTRFESKASLSGIEDSGEETDL